MNQPVSPVAVPVSTPPVAPITTMPARVTVVDFDMSLSNMVGFLVKLAIASIPAALILGGVGLFLVLVARGIMQAMMG